MFNNSIPFINIFTNENKLFMSIKCTNNHYYSKTFDEMEKISKTNPISNISCVQIVINFIVLNMEKHII